MSEFDDDDEAPTRVATVATLYSNAATGQIDFDGFTQMISDLICLRDYCLWAPPESARQVTQAIAPHLHASAGGGTAIEFSHLMELSSRWEDGAACEMRTLVLTLTLTLTQPSVLEAGSRASDATTEG